jgi:urocanate hydratase
VINGGFGLLLDGTTSAQARLENMLFYDVNNGIARRAWARNSGAVSAITRAQKNEGLIVTMPNMADKELIAKTIG